ncbi:hypothetical protein ACIBO5_04365 [Nonomuraea angiospora]|uniref:hypothetical protein n=1 Tax=Nonomuraea angiospora TaxID=46172 RepID=UPI00378C5D22
MSLSAITRAAAREPAPRVTLVRGRTDGWAQLILYRKDLFGNYTLENFSYVVFEPGFWSALVNTLVYTVAGDRAVDRDRAGGGAGAA